ncbi:hypothetical protein ACFX1T_038223 [Malus domestica]
MAEVFWTFFCNSSDCSTESGADCTSGFLSIIDPDSCINNILPALILVWLLPAWGLGYGQSSTNSSIWEAVVDEAVSFQFVVNILYFPGSILFLFTAFQGSSNVKLDTEIHDDAFYTPLQGDESDVRGEINSNDNVTPFAKAGLFSTLSFWWLNPLMKKGKKKLLENEDIPQLREADRARTCYSIFMEQLDKRRKQSCSSDNSSILSIIFLCQRKAILITGFFALIKVLTLSSGPLYLMAFIDVAEGNAAFKYEGYALTLGLFI